MKIVLIIAMMCIVSHPASAQFERTGTAVFSGTVPTSLSVTTAGNGTNQGNSVLMSYGNRFPKTIQLRLRSNCQYRLTVSATAEYGIADGPTSSGAPEGKLVTGDIGFGIVAPIEKNGASVANGPSRFDSIAPGFDATSGVFAKTLHDIFGQDVQILSGDRISASGNDASNDNFIGLTIGISPPAETQVNYSGVITITISHL